MNYCKTRLLPDTATCLDRPIGGDRVFVPSANILNIGFFYNLYIINELLL